MSEPQDESENEEAFDDVDYYRVDDCFVPNWPPAAHVYMRTPEDEDFKHVCSFGTLKAAQNLKTILEDYQDVEVKLIDVAAEN